MVKFCPECGAQCNGAKFCSECGTKFSNAPVNASSDLPVAVPVGLQQASSKQFMAAAAAAAPLQPPPPPPPPPHPSLSALPTPSIQVPDAAKGSEAEALYKHCIEEVTRASHGNASAITDFQANCKAYGQSSLHVSNFYDTLVSTIGKNETYELIPKLARLIPSAEKRRELMEEREKRGAVKKKKSSAASNDRVIPRKSSEAGNEATDASLASATRDSLTMSRQSTTGLKSNAGTGTGIISGRYNDHPKCDICAVAFEITKRRHQCRMCGQYICSGCSPAKMLIPPGQQIADAKGYDPSLPQRVCISCAPLLSEHQNDLRQTYGNYTKENPHEAKARLHLPYSGTLDKECRNAADIIGNFFRTEWGASNDQNIPVAFLERANGLAFMTIIKVGFLVTGKVGTGLVIAKLPDGSWSAPSAIGTLGLGGGLEIGGELVEVMLILGSPNAVKVFYKPQVNIGAGLDLTVGPYGRSAAAAVAASAGGLNSNYSYSHSRGLYAGISLQGAVIATRKDINQKFYGRDVSAEEILTGSLGEIRAARPLYDAIAKAIESCSEFKEGQAQMIMAIGPCRTCACSTYVPHNTQKWNKKCKSCKHIHNT